MALREIFAANLRRERKRAEFSQEELALLAKVDRTYISALERSVYSASIDMIERLSLVLKVKPFEFLREEDGGHDCAPGPRKPSFRER